LMSLLLTAIKSTACWTSQVEETEFFETNKENINSLGQNKACNSAKKSSDMLKINNKQQ
ncbi:6857_t:CDS:1, partial [Cetraspora pellucida]